MMTKHAKQTQKAKRIKTLPQGDAVKRMTIRIRRDLARDAKVHAAQESISFQALVDRALRNEMERSTV